VSSLERATHEILIPDSHYRKDTTRTLSLQVTLKNVWICIFVRSSSTFHLKK